MIKKKKIKTSFAYFGHFFSHIDVLGPDMLGRGLLVCENHSVPPLERGGGKEWGARQEIRKFGGGEHSLTPLSWWCKTKRRGGGRGEEVCWHVRLLHVFTVISQIAAAACSCYYRKHIFIIDWLI